MDGLESKVTSLSSVISCHILPFICRDSQLPRMLKHKDALHQRAFTALDLPALGQHHFQIAAHEAVRGRPFFYFGVWFHLWFHLNWTGKKDMTWNEPWAESTRWASVFDIFAFFWWPGHQKWRKMRGQWVSGRCGGQKGQPHGWDVRSWVLSWVRWCSSWNMAIGICPTVNVAICGWRTWFSVGESWGLRDGNSSHVGVHSWGIAFIEYLWRKCDPLLTYWKTTPNSVISVT